ncbi:MAG: T9SS type A sorting domain-containing protein [Lewinellaceae bacterium]|nr:T9SS type A sorting domain-containing protein [Lewinellaceae bacterium]
MKNKLYLLLFLSGIQFSTLYAQPGFPDLSNGPSWEKSQHGLSLNRKHSSVLTSNRFYVDKDAVTGNNTGQSWENAFTDLQQALFLAEPGDTIWVAEGTYYPTPGEDRTASFSLKQGVAMYGGFAATEASLAARNLWGHPTVLSGDIGVAGDSTDNVYHVVKALGVDSTTLIDGFVIEYGQANKDNSSNNIDNRGGGMLIAGSEAVAKSSPRIANCHFRFNTGRTGAGVYLKSAAADENLLRIENCKFEHNNSLFGGGGLYVDAILSPDAELWLKRDTFLSNRAIEGGGVSLNNLRSLRVDSCIFSANEVTNHGGGIAYLNSIEEARVRFNHSTFEGNKARVYGGFLFTPTSVGTPLEDSLLFSFDHCVFKENQASQDVGSALVINNISRYQKVELSNSLFEGNFPDDAIFGYFWENSVSEWDIDKCVFKNNAPFPMSLGGGAINLHGTLTYGSKKVTTTITNSIFTGNGGAISISAGLDGQFNTYIKNCTFFNNGRYAIAKSWGEVYNDSTWYNNLEISNSVLWEEDTQLPGLQSIFYNGDPDAPSLYDYRISHTAVSAPGCSEPGSEEACGEGMVFGIYPEFIDTLNGNLQLSACSPLLNLGSNTGLDSLNIFTDILGAARIQDSIVDLGAYERASFSVAVDTLADPTCIGKDDGFVSFELNGTVPYEYLWVTDSTEGVAPEMLAADDYSFTVTDASHCQDTITISLADPLPMEVEAMVEPASQASGGSIAILETLGGTPPYDYLWSTGAVGTTISALSIGTYGLTVTDANGCESQWEYEVMLVNSQREPLGESEFVVYPNPVAQGGELLLRYPGNRKNATLRLYDSSGKLLGEHEPPAKGISTKALAPGVYWLTLMNENGQILEKRGCVVY